MKAPIVAPSILAANIGSLLSEVQSVEQGGADWLHVDVMDGRFVPPITFGTNVVESLRKESKLFLDVHLMIEQPELHLDAFAKAGSHRLIVHQETCPHLHRTLSSIKDLGIENGVAINPGTPVEHVHSVLEVADLVLVMTVNPGWGGQKFIRGCLEKIRRLRAEIEKRKLPTLIEVDGGINADTAKECVDAGASVLVAGSSVFGAQDRTRAIAALR